MNILFLPKLFPRADIIGGPILIYHRIKNLSSMGHKITLIAPAYTDEDRNDTTLESFCEKIIRVDSVREGGDNENVRRCYWNSDVFVAPIELGTGFRGKLLEAMACGLPVVATRRATFGINPEHGVDMFVADDYGAFSEYVIMLLKDVELRKKISNNALALAMKFDHKHAAEKLEQSLIPLKPE
ncbi:MAG: glycosyltransferase [Acidobacteriota bacterium]|nr:glycosyltransferase [Acidobacteriota bacterium]